MSYERPRFPSTRGGATDEEWGTLFRELLPLAEKGEAQAQDALADVYLNWKNAPTKTPHIEILKWRRLAAEQTGDSSIENKVGLAYYNLGVKGRYSNPHFPAVFGISWPNA